MINEPVYSYETEEAVIGAVLARPELFEGVAKIIAPSDFFITRFRIVFQALLDLYTQGQDRWDFLTVTEYLLQQGRLGEVGGREKLVALVTDVPSSQNALLYAQVVRAATMRRRLQQLAEMAGSSASADMPVDDILERVETELEGIRHLSTNNGHRRRRAAQVYIPALPAEAGLSQAAQAAADQSAPLLKAYMEWATKRSSVTPAYFLEAGYIWLVSVAAARRACVQIGGKRYFSLIWILWVAITTRYAKSTGLACINDVLELAFPHMLIPNQSTPEALVATLAGKTPDNMDTLPESDRKRITKGLHFAAQRGLLIDEASSLLGASKKDYMHGVVELLLQTYDAKERLEFSTKGQGLQIIRRPGLNILGATTPMAMARYVKADQWETGEMARYALLCPDGLPDKVIGFISEDVEYDPPAEVVDGLKRLHERLPPPADPYVPDAPSEVLHAAIDQDALERLDIYKRAIGGLVNDDLDLRLHGNYGRLPAIALVVALNLALSDWSLQAEGNRPVIRLGHAARAQQIVESWRASLHRLLPALDETADSRGQSRILALLRHSQGMTARDLGRHCGMTTREIQSALAVLLESGEITYQEYTPANGGKPTRLYRDR